MAVWLVRVLDGEDPVGSGSRFSDVGSGVWWAPFVERLAELEVTAGCAVDPLRFCPRKVVTRGEMATFLVRAFGWGSAGSAGFVDVGGVHEGSVDTLSAEGVTAGCAVDPLRFCPGSPVKRGEMATFLVRAGSLGLLEDPLEVLKRVDGAVLSVGSNTGFDPGDVEMVEVDGLLDDVEGLVPGSGVWLDSDVDFDGVFLLTLDIPPPPDDDSVPLVFHFRDDGEVDVRVGLWDEEAGTVTVAVDEFSILGSTWATIKKCSGNVKRCAVDGAKKTKEVIVDAKDTVVEFGKDTIEIVHDGVKYTYEKVEAGVFWFADMIDDMLDSLTGRTDPPDPCFQSLTRNGERLARLDGNLEAVHECVEHRGGDVGVTVKSNRGYIQLVTTPAGAKQVNVGKLRSWAGDIARLVGRIETVKPDSYALYGGVGMSYRLSGSVAGAFPIYAYPTVTLDVLSFLLNLLLPKFDNMLGRAFGPIVVQIGKCVIETTGNMASRIKSALNCVATNLTSSKLEEELTPALSKKVDKILGKTTLSKNAKKLAKNVPWAQVSISVFDAVKDRGNPGAQTITITPPAATPTTTTTTQPTTTTTTVPGPGSILGSTQLRIAYGVLGPRSYSGLWVVDADGTNRERLNFEYSGLVWSPDGARLAYVGCPNPRLGCSVDRKDQLWVLDADSGEQKTLATADSVLQWSPDGGRITYQVLSDDGRAEIWVVNADGANRTQLTTSGYGRTTSGYGRWQGWSPDGARIAYEVRSDDWPELWVVDTDGTNRTQLTTDLIGYYDLRYPGWSPDGARIAWPAPGGERERGDVLWVADADGTNRTQLTTNGWWLGWSPDGAKIAYDILSDDERVETWVVDADGANRTQLTTNGAGLGWSPDGTRIAYQTQSVANDPHPQGIWVVDADGTNRTRLTTSGHSRWQGWSPDGTKIAYWDQFDGTEIWVVDADGNNRTQIATNGWWRGSSPDGTRIAYQGGWSPDGTRIAYQVGAQLWVVDADGTNRKLLDAQGQNPQWSPDSTKIAYEIPGQGLWIVDADGTNRMRLTPEAVGGVQFAVWSGS